MLPKLTNTSELTTSVNICVYGPPSIGKTVLCATAPNPLIISGERGLLSLKKANIPTMELTRTEEVKEVGSWIESGNANNFDTICIDSISDLARIVITEGKQKFKDPRQAYSEMTDVIYAFIKRLINTSGINFYFVSQMAATDSGGMKTYAPMMPSQTLSELVPYMFDELFCYRMGRLEDRTEYRYLQTNLDMQYNCRDRSGVLMPKEKPDLTYLINKILEK